MNLHQQLLESAKNYADRVAYSYLGKNRTYTELSSDVEYCAGAMERRGIGQGDKVALLLPNCEEFIITYYAITSLGATVVPINPTYTPQEIGFILQDAQVKGVVAMGTIAEGFLKMAEVMPVIKTLKLFTTHSPVESLESIQDLMAEKKGPTKWPVVQEDDVAVILYTSGTTGKPKGAMLTNKNLISNAVSTRKHINLKKEDSIICVLPLFHVFCMTVCMNMSIITGCKSIILPRFSPKDVVEAIREQEATIFVGVPTMYTMILNYSEVQKADLQSLRFGISGGASLPVKIWQQFLQTFDVKIVEGYGLSETSPVCSFNPLSKQKTGSIGVPIPDVEMKIVDEGGKELSSLEVGEIVVKGPNVMKGYYNNPEATAEAMKDDWFHTGDLGNKDEEGYYYIVDRKKDMILVGGYNVYPREVEEVLYQIPQVEEVAVVGMPNDVYGEDVMAYIKLKEGQLITEDAIKEYCQQNLAKYKVPKEIGIVLELPKNSTGKIMRRVLKEIVKGG